MRGVTIEVQAQLVTETCCRSDCGILFAVPDDWQRRRRRDHSSFYCPNGHSQSYTGKTEEEKLRDELARVKRDRDWHAGQRARLADDNMDLSRSNRALKGVATKLRKKAARGQCGFCEQRFPDIEAHVRESHPDELAAVERERVEAAGAEDAGAEDDGDG